jgi:hypothetical protein
MLALKFVLAFVKAARVSAATWNADGYVKV